MMTMTRLVSFPFVATSVTSISALSGVGNPNGVVLSVFLGQTYYDTANTVIYLCRVAGVNNQWVPVGP